MAFHVGLVQGQLGFEGALLRNVDDERQGGIIRFEIKHVPALVDLQRHVKVEVEGLGFPGLDRQSRHLAAARGQFVFPILALRLQREIGRSRTAAMIDQIDRIRHGFARRGGPF
ncbi:hypothetical protein D3C76_1479580 [compost metagenome]